MSMVYMDVNAYEVLGYVYSFAYLRCVYVCVCASRVPVSVGVR